MSVQALIAAIISGNFQIKTGIENSIKKASIVCHNPYFSIDTFISSTIGLKCSIRNAFPLYFAVSGTEKASMFAASRLFFVSF